MVKIHSYDILGARMLWKPKKSIKFVKIRKIRQNLLKFASNNVMTRC
jgi:hypothetical protein